MKKVLSLVLALALVLGSFAPVFAADSQYADEGALLKELGVLTGDETGDLGLDDTLTRDVLFTLVSRLIEPGAENETAYAVVGALFNDVEQTDWFAAAAGWASLRDLTAGVGDNNFGPGGTVTVQQMQTVLLRALGYTDADAASGNLYNDAAAMAATAGIMGDIEDTNATKGLLAALTVNTLKANKTDGTQLADALNIDLPTDEEPVVEGLTVESITAKNLKEIEIKFTGTVNEEEAETSSNYTIGSVTSFTAALQEDGKTVLLTETSTGTAFAANQETVEITVSDDIVDAEYTEDVFFFDATIPVAEKVKLTGPNTFEITFSEPITQAVDGTVEFEDGIYGLQTFTADGTNVVEITLNASTLEEGEYKVDVSAFEDFAGHHILATELTLNYVEDTTIPTATVKSATQTEVVIEFDRVVKDEDGAALDASYFYHTFTSYNPTNVAVDGNKTFTLDFSNYPLPEGTIKIVIDYDANSKDITDDWGNAMVENVVFYQEITADVTKPEVAKVDVVANAQDQIKVYFSEDVVIPTADNFTVKDSDGDEVTISNVTYAAVSADKEYYATLTFSSDLNGNYTVEVVDVLDKALEANEITTVTKAFTVTDVTAPNLAAFTAKYVEGSSADFIYVTFPEKMATSGEYSVLEKNNYLVSGTALSADDKIEVFGGSSDKVKITIADETDFDFTAGLDLQVARLEDASGIKANVLAATTTIVADTAPVVTAVKTINANTVEITIDQPLTTVTADGIIIANGTTPSTIYGTLASVAWKVNDDNETVLTGTLKATVNLTDSADKNIEVVVVGSKLKSETGKFMAQEIVTENTATTVGAVSYTGITTPVAITDGYAPSFVAASSTTTVAVASVTGGSITVAFDETMAATATQDAIANDLIIDIDGDVLNPFIDYTTALSGTDVTVTFAGTISADFDTDSVITVKLADPAKYLTDAADNAPNAFEHEITID